MKSFILCTGLSLLLVLQAHAQDTVQKSLPDTTRPVTAIPANNDSIRIALEDSLKQKHLIDSTKTSAREDSTKIVDIFEEMQKARDQQDNNIKKEAAQKAADVAADQLKKQGISQQSPSTAKVSTDSSDIDSRKKNSDSPIESLFQKSEDTTTIDNNSHLHAKTDSSQKDTIQSIFTLPVPPSTVADTGTIALDSPNVSRGDQSSRQQQTKGQIKDNLNALFEATADSASADSNKIIQKNSPANRDSSINKNNANLQSEKQLRHSPDSANTPTYNLNKPTIDSVAEKSDDSNAHNTRKQKNMPITGQWSRTDSSGLSAPKTTSFTELFQPYLAFNKETNISSTTSLTILQQNVDYQTSTDFTTQYQRTGQRDGQFLFDVSVIKLNTQVETMGVQLKYDSNQRTDSTSTFAKPLFDIVGKKTFLEVDSTGKITSVDSTSLGRQVNSVLSGLSLSGGDFEVGSNFGLLLSKSEDSAAGESWTDSVSHGGNKRVTTYTVQSILDGDMLIIISGTVSQTGEISSDGAIFKTHFTGIQKGKMYVDQKTLLVKSREITLTMKGTVDYNGQALPASAVSKINEKVTTNR